MSLVGSLRCVQARPALCNINSIVSHSQTCGIKRRALSLLSVAAASHISPRQDH